MVVVTRMDGSHLILNAVMIETVESTPDTVVTMVSGRKFVIKEPAADLVERATVYYRRVGLIGISRAAGSETSDRES
jgi:flagellar protein FlbD